MTSTFEDRLLTELQREAHLAAAENPAPARRARRTRLRVATGLAAATAIAGSTLAFPGGTAPTAYAVEHNDDGTVSLFLVDELTVDAQQQAALADELRAAGIAVLLDPAGEDGSCDWPEHGVLNGNGEPMSGFGNSVSSEPEGPVEMNQGGPLDLEGEDIPQPAQLEEQPAPTEEDEAWARREFSAILEPGNVVVIDNMSAPYEGVRMEFFETDPGPCVPADSPTE
ncbi:hypothetical protein ACL02R_18760 [Streptomyces sp. MS19]|uniref:hypothetical protein n=1 Tax=Streptomyces sp. MS19 TaxID=3385972 RepID=UPI0039A1615E